MSSRRVTEVFVVLEAILIVGLLSWLVHESETNPYLDTWLSENLPVGALLVNRWVAFAISGALFSAIVVLIIKVEREGESRGVETPLEKPIGRTPLESKGFEYRGAGLGLIAVIGVFVLGIGALRGAMSLVLVGLGLLVWGTFQSSRQPSSLVRRLDAAATVSTAEALHSVLSELEPERGPLYVPRRSETGELRVSLVIFYGPPIFSASASAKESPPRQAHFLPAPGDSLLQLVEQRMGVDFSTVPLVKLPDLLSRAILDEFRLADDFECTSTGPIFHFRIFNCVYAETCNKVSSSGHHASRIGCPFCSMIACSLGKTSGRPVSIESTAVSSSGAVTDLTCRYLDDEEWMQLKSGADARVAAVQEPL